MTPKRLHLPNPPGDLWEHIRSSLDEALVEILDPGEQWALGGGTLLAAEWEHRATKDIDLKLEPGTREDRLEPEQNRHYIARLEALGATEWHGTGNQLVVSFGGKSLVDLFESRSRPRGAQLARTVNGRPERVLSSAQILAGKLTGRGLLSPTKDVYDIAVARRMDRKALEIAVNCLSRKTIELITERWGGLTLYHQGKARTELESVPEAFRDIAANPAAHAVEGALDCRYRQVTLRWNRERLEVQTLTEDGEQRKETLASGSKAEIEGAVERSGLADYIVRNTGFQVSTIVELADRAREKSRTGRTQMIWGTAPPPPPEGPLPAGSAAEEEARRRRDHER